MKLFQGADLVITMENMKTENEGGIHDNTNVCDRFHKKEILL